MENNKIHISTIPMSKRLLAYLTILVGYFFYCYNFSVIDYVRPFLVEDYGMTMEQTALFYTWQSVGAMIGAFGCAWLAENFGRKRVLISITLINGICTIVNMIFPTYFLWALMRLVIGISLGGYYTVAVATMVGLFEPKVRGKVVATASILFPISTIVMANLGGFFGEAGWESILWLGGIPPIIAALCMVPLVPDDKKVEGYGLSASTTVSQTETKKGTWGEMFSSKYARFTISCMLLSGLNFMGYQFFSGFITVYLLDIRGFDMVTMGILISAASSGQLIGGWLWGASADKFGRKINAFGFFLSSIMLCFYFIAPQNVMILSIIGFFYGVGLNSASIWGGYFTEMFPLHLRSMGASLFHGGRIISLFAPSMVVAVGNMFSLEVAMWGAPFIFTVAGLLWLTLPETFKKGKLYKGYDPNEPAQA
ncbi:MFS transporter [Candidatus Epulonipiscium fishelsonii]|uniref:MFS transporter n=1 Tax=Candidatus Epulonipiscium fishelsonii TaxID=77094 RepID=A0ACC8XAZ4_9FIRM|nr:MFS transporter [Epulopiscium sp. SCG-B05WGA-EpuloA1]ONI39564.1 MFS transporter [Epulopiscium sp. SCG-B11WGA-EpuloA1]